MQQRASIVRSLAVEPVGAADGRALRRARRLHPRRDEPADPGNLDGDGQDHRLRHAFDRRGDLPGRPRRGDVGAARADRRDLSTSTFRGRARSRSRRSRISSSACCDDQVTHRARHAASMPACRSPEHASLTEARRGQTLGDKIPEFNKKARGGGMSDGIAGVSLAIGRTPHQARDLRHRRLSPSSSSAAPELLLAGFKVPQYVLPQPSQIVTALVTEFPNHLAASPDHARWSCSSASPSAPRSASCWPP